jgi:hypothetical protein
MGEEIRRSKTSLRECAVSCRPHRALQPLTAAAVCPLLLMLVLLGRWDRARAVAQALQVPDLNRSGSRRLLLL